MTATRAGSGVPSTSQCQACDSDAVSARPR